jgi:hypothetical protein
MKRGGGSKCLHLYNLLILLYLVEEINRNIPSALAHGRYPLRYLCRCYYLEFKWQGFY